MLKIFLATGAREYLMLLLLCNVKNILVSFEYPEPYQCKRLLQQNGVKLMIDSGAFSAWSKGRVINIDEYIEFIKQNSEVIDKERIVNLDIILGGREGLIGKAINNGETTLKDMWLDTINKPAGQVNNSSPKEFEEACKKGFENYYYLKEKLSEHFKEEIFPIHVFHQGDNFKWLEKMLKECKTIGISPNNDETDSSKDVWLMECFKMVKEINPDIKTHAFGVTSDRLLSKFPYTTADSSSWALTSAFGSILTPLGRFVVSDESKNKPGHIDQFPEATKQALQKYLDQFGFSLDSVRKKYKYRNIVNIFHFLDLEKRINEKGHTFDQYKQIGLPFSQRASEEEIEKAKEIVLKDNVL